MQKPRFTSAHGHENAKYDPITTRETQFEISSSQLKTFHCI